jgi:DNA polymerase-3 subunit beta
MTTKPYKIRKQADTAPAPDPGAHGPATITLDRKALLGPLERACHVIPGKSSIPVLSNVLLDLGPRSRLYATDLSTSVITEVSIETQEPRRILLPAKLMKDILAGFDDQQITLVVDDRQITIKSGPAVYRIATADPDEFPRIEPVTDPPDLSISAGDFIALVNRIYHAIGVDDTRYVLTGIHLHTGQNTLTLESSDGFRAARVVKTFVAELNPCEAVIPRRLFQILPAFAGDLDNLDITVTDKKVQIVTARSTILAARIEGKFPDIEGIMTTAAFTARVDRPEFLRLLKRASIMSIQHEPVQIDLGKDHPDHMILTVESSAGAAQERLDCDYEGDEQRISLNIRFLLDVLPKLSGDHVDMGLPSGYGAIQIREDQYDNILMPLRS